MAEPKNPLADTVVNNIKVCDDAQKMRDIVTSLRAQGRKIGFVPTMGALHAGHLSLVEASRLETDITIVSIFVNPKQFSDPKDLERYPRTLFMDMALLSPLGVKVIFAPKQDEVYPPGYSTSVEVSGVTDRWEGEFRPGHFAGVATVVLKLFNIVQPDIAFFGQKDYQQTLVVQRMVRDLNAPVQIKICSTVRERDGLAMSSRNALLTPDDRQQGLVLSRSLKLGSEIFAAGERDAAKIRQRMLALFKETSGVTVEYLAIVDPDHMREVSHAQADSVAIIAARVGSVRLIDNCILGERIPWKMNR
jgi:pantoate--beta-alanine ligase